MNMHNPPHPGEFIMETYIEPFNLSVRQVALNLGVSPSTLTRLLNGNSNISPVMALRLAKAFGRSPESWLALQDQYDLWHAKRTTNLKKVKSLGLAAI